MKWITAALRRVCEKRRCRKLHRACEEAVFRVRMFPANGPLKPNVPRIIEDVLIEQGLLDASVVKH